MDNIEALAEQNLKINGGKVPEYPLPSLGWNDLLLSEASLAEASEKIIAMAETNGRRLAGAEQDAVDLSCELLKNIRKEKASRDRIGNRGPRSTGGRLSEPSYPGDDGKPANRMGRPRSAKVADVFGSARTKGDGGFKSLGEMALAIDKTPNDPRLIRNAADGMSEGIGETGGFLIGPSFGTELLDGALENEIVRPFADVWPVTTNQLVVGQFDLGGDHSGGNIGGLVTQWTDEGQEFKVQKGKMIPWTCRVNKANVFVPCNTELFEDVPNFDRWIGEAMTDALSFGMDDAFLNGNGAGQPLGVLNSPSLIVVAKESSQSTATVIGTNLLNMMDRLHPKFESSSVWVVSPSVRRFLYATSQEQGVDMPGVNRTVTSVGTNLYIMGRRVLVSEKLAAIGTQGDILLADLTQYRIALRHDLRLEKSFDQFFSSDQIAYRLKYRAGGQGIHSKVVTPKGGGATLSWAVTLAVRP